MSSQREHSGSHRIYVLDTTAFLAKYPMLYHGPAQLYTVPGCIEETRDKENREALELAASLGRVNVARPDKEYIEKVRRAAEKAGTYNVLSDTDIEVAALAAMLAERHDVVVITDDYALQRTLLELGIPFKPLRTRGIREKRGRGGQRHKTTSSP